MTARKNETDEQRAARAAYQKAYREANKERLLAYDKTRYQENKERDRPIRRERWRAWYYQNQTRMQQDYKVRATRYRTKLRLEVLQAYSQQEVPECACCGENILEFLCLDHINNDGAQHRKEIGAGRGKGGPDYTYRWARMNGYPPIFQVLCNNCNMAKGFYGQCPHERMEFE